MHNLQYGSLSDKQENTAKSIDQLYSHGISKQEQNLRYRLKVKYNTVASLWGDKIAVDHVRNLAQNNKVLKCLIALE